MLFNYISILSIRLLTWNISRRLIKIYVALNRIFFSSQYCYCSKNPDLPKSAYNDCSLILESRQEIKSTLTVQNAIRLWLMQVTRRQAESAPRHKTAYIQFEITMGGPLSRTLRRRLNDSNLKGKTTEFDFARVSMRRNPSLSARSPAVSNVYEIIVWK